MYWKAASGGLTGRVRVNAQLIDAETDALTLWLSAQDTHRPLSQLAHLLRRPVDSLRIIVPDVGGAFGSKGVIAPEVAAVAVAAMRLGAPVKWIEWPGPVNRG